jgi:FixJ family two-component response regulator
MSWQMMSLLRVREFAAKTFASAQEFAMIGHGHRMACLALEASMRATTDSAAPRSGELDQEITR